MDKLVLVVMLLLASCASAPPQPAAVRSPDLGPLLIRPGIGLGDMRIAMTYAEVEKLGEQRFTVVDALYVGGYLAGFSTPTGGSVALGGTMVGYPLNSAYDEVEQACGTQVAANPEIVAADLYEKATAVWFWFIPCGLGIRAVIVGDSVGIQSWAVFQPGSELYRDYIATTFVDERVKGQGV